MREQVTQEEYRDTVLVCRDSFRKAKACLEFNLMRYMKCDSKGFYKCMNSKRKTRENVGPLLSGPWDLVAKDTENTNVPSAFFALVFIGMTGLQQSQVSKTDGKAWSREDLLLV